LIALIWWAVSTAVARAHDPGLSTLEIDVHDTVSASLSIAASDVAQLAAGGGAQPALRTLAQNAIHLVVDEESVPPVIEEVSVSDDAARVKLSFAAAPARDRIQRLEVASDVPARITRGHRELLIVRIDGNVVTERLLDAGSGPVPIDVSASSTSGAGTAWRFLELGVHHILSGYDHLMFVAGLLLAARRTRELAAALTAFTAAHSVSLVLVVMGGVHLDPSIVEPLIAASIAWVGLENLLRRPHQTRWLLIFAFGVIHGFGFAGALTELGFGSSAVDVAVALFSFNAGVEAGQFAVAATLLPLVYVMRSRPVWQERLLPLCSATIVLAGGYWLVERLT
jgi:hydrogenase/urease accessory protein HupE